jgi:pilus assembly protein Flp/PilA
MSMIRTQLRRLVRNEEGATMVEYALMVAFVAAISIALVITMGGNVQTAFTNLNSAWTP